MLLLRPFLCVTSRRWCVCGGEEGEEERDVDLGDGN